MVVFCMLCVSSKAATAAANRMCEKETEGRQDNSVFFGGRVWRQERREGGHHHRYSWPVGVHVCNVGMGMYVFMYTAWSCGM